MSAREQWTIADVAAHLKVTTSTVRSYVAREQMPAPDGRLGRTPWWDAETIREWRRPGRGARTDLPPAEDEDEPVEAGAGDEVSSEDAAGEEEAGAGA